MNMHKVYNFVGIIHMHQNHQYNNPMDNISNINEMFNYKKLILRKINSRYLIYNSNKDIHIQHNNFSSPQLDKWYLGRHSYIILHKNNLHKQFFPYKKYRLVYSHFNMHNIHKWILHSIMYILLYIISRFLLHLNNTLMNINTQMKLHHSA